jgi:integrase
MTALKQKPNGVYYLDTEVPDGKGGTRRSRVGLKTKDRAEAEAQRRDWIAGVHPLHPAVGGVIAPKGRQPSRNGSTMTKLDTPYVTAWLAQCLSHRDVWLNCRADATHRSNVRILGRYLPSDLQIGQVTTALVKQLTDDLFDAGYAPASVRKLTGSLSAACRHAVREGVLSVMPDFPSITVENERDRVVSLDEEAALLDCILTRRQAEPLRAWWHFERLTVLLLDTGVRLTEAILAGPSWVKRKRWTDPLTGETTEGVWLSIPRRTIYNGREIIVTKSKKPRDVPLSDRALRVIEELNERVEGTRWFPWAKGSSGPLYLLSCLRKDMAEKGFQFDDVVLHTFRHTCATRLAEGGLDLVALRDWLGHSDIKITAGRYLHLMNSHVWRGATILNTISSVATGRGNAITHGAPCSIADREPCGTDRAEAGATCHA